MATKKQNTSDAELSTSKPGLLVVAEIGPVSGEARLAHRAEANLVWNRLGVAGEAPTYAAPDLFRAFEDAPEEATVQAKPAVPVVPPAGRGSEGERSILLANWKHFLRCLFVEPVTDVMVSLIHWGISFAIPAMLLGGIVSMVMGRPGGFLGPSRAMLDGLVGFLVFAMAMAVPAAYCAWAGKVRPAALAQTPWRAELFAVDVATDGVGVAADKLLRYSAVLSAALGSPHVGTVAMAVAVAVCYVWTRRAQHNRRYLGMMAGLKHGGLLYQVAEAVHARCAAADPGYKDLLRAVAPSGGHGFCGGVMGGAPYVKLGNAVVPQKHSQSEIWAGLLHGLGIVSRETGQTFLAGVLWERNEVVFVVRGGKVFDGNGLLGASGLAGYLESVGGHPMRSVAAPISEVVASLRNLVSPVPAAACDGLTERAFDGRLDGRDWRARNARELLSLEEPFLGKWKALAADLI